jgi:hypothetical protein
MSYVAMLKALVAMTQQGCLVGPTLFNSSTYPSPFATFTNI